MFTVSIEPPTREDQRLAAGAALVLSELRCLAEERRILVIRPPASSEAMTPAGLRDSWRRRLPESFDTVLDFTTLVRQAEVGASRAGVSLEELLRLDVGTFYREHLLSERRVEEFREAGALMARLEELGAMQHDVVSIVDRYLLQLHPVEWEDAAELHLRTRALQLGYLLASLTARSEVPELFIRFFVEPVSRDAFRSWKSARERGLEFDTWAESTRGLREQGASALLDLLRGCVKQRVELEINEVLESSGPRLPHDRSLWLGRQLVISTAGFRLLPAVAPRTAKCWTAGDVRRAIEEARDRPLHQQTLLVRPREHQAVARPEAYTRLTGVTLDPLPS